MTYLNRAQRLALKRVFDRQPIVVGRNRTTTTTLTYWGFRKRVVGAGTRDAAIAVKWCGMWLCIEGDGYVHS